MVKKGRKGLNIPAFASFAPVGHILTLGSPIGKHQLPFGHSEEHCETTFRNATMNLPDLMLRFFTPLGMTIKLEK
jgi:hypothetical protein